MNNEAMKEVLNELFSHLERLETQSEAILQFLKEKKRVTDKQLAPYLEQAGNASNVKWRAARVRIDHLLEPEHPEKEIKLGKKPELHEDSSSTASSEEKRSEPDAEEEKRVESVDEKGKGTGDQKQIETSDKDAKKTQSQNAKASEGEPSNADFGKKEKPAPVEAVQARPADGKKDKQEAKSEVERKNAEQTAQERHETKSESDGLHHPTELTEPLAEKEGAAPAAQLKPDKTDSGKEAA
jgi:hypothetical protein